MEKEKTQKLIKHFQNETYDAGCKRLSEKPSKKEIDLLKISQLALDDFHKIEKKIFKDSSRTTLTRVSSIDDSFLHFHGHSLAYDYEVGGKCKAAEFPKIPIKWLLCDGEELVKEKNGFLESCKHTRIEQLDKEIAYHKQAIDGIETEIKKIQKKKL